jgi:hypothetical protein
MYIYMMPLANSRSVAVKPKHDGGLEHTAAEFANAREWVDRSKRGEVIVISPQSFLLGILAQFLVPSSGARDLAAERAALLEFTRTVPTGPSGHATTRIPWSEKVMSPTPTGLIAKDGRMIIALDGPGPELAGQRAGDYDRVVVSRRERSGPSGAEVVWRKDVWPQAEARARAAKAAADAAQAKL